jgi:hypothetical protein
MIYNKLPKAIQGCNISIRSEFLGGEEHVKYAYELRYKGKLLFSGKDFSPSPIHFPIRGYSDTLGKWALYSLLGFLTLQPGNVDKEYFKGYTKEQFDFLASNDAECIRLALNDFENGEVEL